ncbi:MAG: response regulator [Cyanosarcina radialis HA8281-LM2]|jgi:PAS domain S-box-containing protein|nr:response regulator [Cyanosarcina radialis HA8281-LM2]
MTDDRSTAEQLFAGNSEMAMRMRSQDWSNTSLGAVATWPQSLKTSVRIMLTSSQPMWVWWGRELLNLYNDAYRAILGGKHPRMFARPAAEVWQEIWDVVGPKAESTMLNNEGTYDESLLLIMERNGYPEETYYTFSYSPIPDDRGNPGGIICANTDDTQRIISERQLALLQELAAKTADARTFDEACTMSAKCLETNPYDLPLAMIYLVDTERQCAVLAGTSGIERTHPAVPATVDLNSESVWSFAEAIQTQKSVLISDLIARFGNLPTGAWDRVPQQAIVVPIAPSGQTGRSGILVAGLNPLRLFDDNYRSFINLVAGQISASVANANAYEEERRRAEALAELDRAKTAFFSNVSHEFRTPLTLMISPLEELAINLDDRLQPAEREQLQLVQRNGLRLQKLVNALLDFSRIEAGRVQASYEPTDLATYTAELASVFRSLIERAGMTLQIDCPPLPEPVYVDREMWEKIVLNLISNAFKFTFTGSITVRLQPVGNSVELSVTDTGVGIPAAELPRLFERFHRINGTRSRTYEGSGIGLALVQELVKLHGGTIRVTSQIDRGSTFAIAIPCGAAHLPPDRLEATRTLASTALGANPYVEEASRWLPDGERGMGRWGDGEIGSEIVSSFSPPHPLTTSSLPQILLADDNADMREYLKRLLSQHYQVETVADGRAALTAIRQQMPDLVLSDVMMPNLDGFGLLRELRADSRTQEIPIILLSARAGEESRIEGLEAGADDYLIKPFSARELMARVEATLKLSRLRQETAQAIHDREQRLKLAVEGGRMVAWEWNPFDDTIVTTSNFSEIYGLPEIQSVALGLTLVHPEDRSRHQTTVENAVATGSNYRSEFRFIRPDNSAIVWLEERGQVILNDDGSLQKLIGVTIDITDRQQAEEALARSRHQFEKIAETTPDLVYVFDLTQGRNIYINAGVDRILGYSQEQIAAFGPVLVESLVHPDDIPGVIEGNQRFHDFGDRDVYDHELRMRHANGDYCWLRCRDAVFERAADGTVTKIIGTAQDVTDRKQAEVEREQLLAREQAAREAAEAANRIKDEFLAVLSHELRSPLNPILGWSKLLQRGKLNAEKTQAALAAIDRNAQLQSQLIEDLLDISRILRGKLSLNIASVDLAQVISAALETVQLAAEAKGIELKFEVIDPGVRSQESEVRSQKSENISPSSPSSPSLPLSLSSSPHPPISPSPHLYVMGDPGRLQQVFWNLLSNAVKFTPEGGRITAILNQSATNAQIQVIDTGKGINPDFLPYVFEHFRQEDGAITRKFGGLGLGLAIARQIVEMHGGQISVNSLGEGQGATFTVRLPLAPATSQPSPLAGYSVSTGGDLSGVRILVVDDDADSLEIATFVLEEAGAIVTRVGSGIEALQAIRANAQANANDRSVPDLIVSDIGMPEMDGYMLVQQIRSLEQFRDIPAIALTAYAAEFDRHQALKAGFQQHMAKPIEPNELIAAIARIIRQNID